MPAAYRHRLFVAVSPSTADALAGMGVDRSRIRIIINGTNLPDEVGAEWTPARLDARQARMARRAVHLWRVDFV